MTYPNPQPDLTTRAKQELEVTKQQVGGFFKRSFRPEYQLYWTYGLVALAGLAYAVYAGGDYIRMRFLGGQEQLDAARKSAVVSWQLGAPGQAGPLDVNGDGKLDFIGGFRGLDPAGDYLGAFDGKTGAQLWRLGPVKLGVRRAFVPIGNKLFVAQTDGTAGVYQLNDGRQLRTGKLPHAVQYICPDPSGSESVTIKNYNQHSRIDLGALTSSASDGAWCAQMPVLGVGLVPAPGRETDRGARQVIENQEFTFQSLIEGGKGVLVARKLETQAVVWQRAFPAESLRSIALSDVKPGGVLYVAAAKKLFALEPATGKGLWETAALPEIAHVQVISASVDAVYVPTRGLLHVVEPSTGALRFTLGAVP